MAKKKATKKTTAKTATPDPFIDKILECKDMERRLSSLKSEEKFSNRIVAAGGVDAYHAQLRKQMRGR